MAPSSAAESGVSIELIGAECVTLVRLHPLTRDQGQEWNVPALGLQAAITARQTSQYCTGVMRNQNLRYSASIAGQSALSAKLDSQLHHSS